MALDTGVLCASLRQGVLPEWRPSPGAETWGDMWHGMSWCAAVRGAPAAAIGHLLCGMTWMAAEGSLVAPAPLLADGCAAVSAAFWALTATTAR